MKEGNELMKCNKGGQRKIGHFKDIKFITTKLNDEFDDYAERRINKEQEKQL